MKKKDSLVGLSYSDFIQSRRTNQITTACLSVALCVTSILAFRNNVETIVTPPDYASEVTVRGNRANEMYMIGHAMGVASLVGNINQRNVDFVVDRVTTMMTPYLRSNLEEALIKEAQILKIRKASQDFVIDDMMYEPKNNIVWVWGTKTLRVSTGTQHSQRWTYELRIEPHAGAPRITHFDAYSGLPKKKGNDYVVDIHPYESEELYQVKKSTTDKPQRFKLQVEDATKEQGSETSGENN